MSRRKHTHRPWPLSWITRSGKRNVVAMARLGRGGLVSVLWVVDARTGRAIDVDETVVAERLGLYEAIRDAAKAGA